MRETEILARLVGFPTLTGGPNLELIDWVQANMNERMIGFRTYLPLSLRESGSTYELTPDQTSLLLVETLEAFARSRQKEEIEMLIHAVEQGHPKNRYALVGLLMRAIQ